MRLKCDFSLHFYRPSLTQVPNLTSPLLAPSDEEKRCRRRQRCDPALRVVLGDVKNILQSNGVHIRGDLFDDEK